jgi:heterodisulfide reductase subunit D
VSTVAEQEINLKDYRVYACLECGRCTAVCPISRTHGFSPRWTISHMIAVNSRSHVPDESVWMCLTCKRCEVVCPTDVSYSALNRALRIVYSDRMPAQTCTHGGVFEQIQNLMLNEELKQDRLGWVTDKLKVGKNVGETLFFTGCSPFFAAYFGEQYSKELIGSLRGAVKLMNRIGIEPTLLENERCCGHDLLLRGDRENFIKVAHQVAEQIRTSGAKRVVFTCPECLVTLRDDYPEVGEALDVELLHISQVLESELGQFSFKADKRIVSYQDPCRLGRYSQLYEPPRKAIGSVPNLRLEEMRNNRERAVCCGVAAWVGCDAGTRQMQRQRLEEAAETGAETLLTACPKCFIHLNCALQDGGEDQKPKLQIRDSWEYLASRLA